MSVSGTSVTCTTSPTLIAQPSTDKAGAFVDVVLKNRSAGTIYLGGSSVTTSGYPLSTADDPLRMVLQPFDALYGTSTGSLAVAVLKTRDF